jgi:hypothetical protein
MFILFLFAATQYGLLPSFSMFFLLAAAGMVDTLFSGTATGITVPLAFTGQCMGKPRRLKGQRRQWAHGHR